jgi:two-component system CheB/CheR fusion protein
VNEELQSTNEELETSKEELQSVNEELTTVNSELQTKVADLSQANNDMNNLLAGTGIATIFVDHQLRILRFTPTATKIINLIKSDIGRSVGHIVNNLSGYTTLVADIQEVLDTLISKEIEVQTTDGQWYTMRILPYRTIDNIIEGAVLTFVEITEAHELRESLRMSAERMRVALSIVPLSVFNQDRDLRYTWFRSSDPAFSIQQIIGKTDTDLLQEQEAVALNALKKQVLESGKAVRKNIQATIEDKKFVFDLLIEPLRDATGAVVGITCASIDITRQHDNKQ